MPARRSPVASSPSVVRATRKIEVRESFAGFGVFATRDLPAEHRVGKVRGKRIFDPDYGSNYGIDLGENCTLEPHAPFRFLNHSCEPNCGLFSMDGPSGKVEERGIIVETIREIAAGEQLLIDYGWTADSAIECLCGAASCRGWVVSIEELHLLTKGKKRRKRA